MYSTRTYHPFRILVLKDGQIVEQGSHQELLAKGGMFGDLQQTRNGEQLAPATIHARRTCTCISAISSAIASAIATTASSVLCCCCCSGNGDWSSTGLYPGLGNGCHAPMMNPVSSSLSSLYGCNACSGRSTDGGLDAVGVTSLKGGAGRLRGSVVGCGSWR